MKEQKKIILLYSKGHLGSTILLNKVLKMKCYQVCGIIKAQAINYDSKGLQKAQKKFQKMGFRFSFMLFWQQVIQKLAFTTAKLLRLNKKSLLSASHFENIPSISCKNINSNEAIRFIEEIKPDLLISAYFPQILKEEILELPKIGTLNIHPGILPDMKGAMSYFHVLNENKKEAGVSIHWMDTGIDTGKLISQKSFKISPRMTQENVLVKTAFIGASLLKTIGRKLQNGEPLIEIERTNQGKYFAMPQRGDFLNYMKSHRFFRIRDIVGLILWRPLRKHF